ncbi:MAG: PCRF domain-containing protein, partial [Nitrospinales bacterium]
MLKKLETVEKRYIELNRLLSDPKIIAQQSEFQKYARERSKLAAIVHEYEALKKILREIETNEQILKEESDPELHALANEEIERLNESREAVTAQLKT